MGCAVGGAGAELVCGLRAAPWPLTPGRGFGSSTPALVRPWPGTRKSSAVHTDNVCLQMLFYEIRTLHGF